MPKHLRIPTRPPILINSIPKSGTYLYAHLLERLGSINTNLHLSTSHFWDFGGVPLEAIIAEPDDFKKSGTLSETAKLVQEGQFAVGHIDRTHETEVLLRGFVHLFCVRDIRDVLVSHMRFLLDPRRRTRPNGSWWKASRRSELLAGYLRGPGGAYFKNRILPIAGWNKSPGPPATLRFETIMGDAGREAQARCLETICETTHATPAIDPLTILESDVIGAGTRTYSGNRSIIDPYLTDETRALLSSLGVDALNKELGY